MDKHSMPSIEKFAAFLDGNLSQSEMQQMSQMVESNDALQQMLDANSVINGMYDNIDRQEFQLPEEITGTAFGLPDIDDMNIFSSIGDSFWGNRNLYSQESIEANELQNQESETKKHNDMATSYRTYGEAGENIHDPIYIKQPDDHSCGLRSQQIILRDYGIDIPFEELERYALDAGVYSENGTHTYDIGKVVEMAGVGMHQVPRSTIYDLTNELAQGHRVIVSVDANELWYNQTPIQRLNNWMHDVVGPQGGNHALIVAGVEVNPSDPKDVKVVLTDPGAGHLRIEDPLNQFMDAWKDSKCFMAATDCPAPYQYDTATGMEVPSNFYVEHSYRNPFVVEHGYQLQPKMINVKSDYTPHYVGVCSYDDLIDQMNVKGGSESIGSVGDMQSGLMQEDTLHSHHTGDVGNLAAFEHHDDLVSTPLTTESIGGVGIENTTPLPEDYPHEDSTFGGVEY